MSNNPQTTLKHPQTIPNNHKFLGGDQKGSKRVEGSAGERIGGQLGDCLGDCLRSPRIHQNSLQQKHTEQGRLEVNIDRKKIDLGCSKSVNKSSSHGPFLSEALSSRTLPRSVLAYYGEATGWEVCSSMSYLQKRDDGPM